MQVEVEGVFIIAVDVRTKAILAVEVMDEGARYGSIFPRLVEGARAG